MRAERMKRSLEINLSPTLLEILDQSHLHKGHGGWREEGETHYQITIAAPQLAGKGRLAQHREINQILMDEFANGLHALSLVVKD